MAGRRKRRPTRRRGSTHEDGPPLIVVLSIAMLTLLGYFIGMSAFARFPHPVHWASAAVGGLLGWGLGRIYYRTKGDIV